MKNNLNLNIITIFSLMIVMLKTLVFSSAFASSEPVMDSDEVKIKEIYIKLMELKQSFPSIQRNFETIMKEEKKIVALGNLPSEKEKRILQSHERIIQTQLEKISLSLQILDGLQADLKQLLTNKDLKEKKETRSIGEDLKKLQSEMLKMNERYKTLLKIERKTEKELKGMLDQMTSLQQMMGSVLLGYPSCMVASGQLTPKEAFKLEERPLRNIKFSKKISEIIYNAINYKNVSPYPNELVRPLNKASDAGSQLSCNTAIVDSDRSFDCEIQKMRLGTDYLRVPEKPGKNIIMLNPAFSRELYRQLNKIKVVRSKNHNGSLIDKKTVSVGSYCVSELGSNPVPEYKCFLEIESESI